ncbi:MAG: prepilin-type N-terminal cleavage/methylation domain-containing protein [Gammaproteobacteria bacterium]|nr:prepilin-type N-terminal cleavage/methylation domain-containing protein [Gammaproteobacteria bacterium]
MILEPIPFSENTSGFSLLEVLLSVSIFSVALLGLLGMQTASIQTAYSALLRSQAQIQLVNIAGQCLVSSFPNIVDWQKSNTFYLPQGIGSLHGNSVTLSWSVYNQSENISLPVSC